MADTDTTIRANPAPLVEDEKVKARTEYLAAFGIYQRFPTEENRLAQKRAYERLEEIYRVYGQGKMTMYEFICDQQVQP